MRLGGINNFLRWFANNPWIIILAACASILSYFTGLRDLVRQLLRNLVSIESNLVADIVTFVLLTLIIVAVVSIVGYLIGKRYRKRLFIYSSSIESVLWKDASGQRITEFQKLRSDAKNSMLVMGIGLTMFSQDLSTLKKYLEEDFTIRLLMIDPGIIHQTYQPPDDTYPITIKSDLFDDYFQRQQYSIDVRASYNRLKAFVSDRKKIENKRGRLFLRKSPFFIPMNVTVIDETDKDDKGRMLIEWCLPFSDWRMSSRFSRSHHSDSFETVAKNIEELWNRSQPVIDDIFES